MGFLWVLLLVFPFALLSAMQRNNQRLAEARAATVELRADEFGVRREMADGREEQVDWSDVNEVEVVRANRGAHKPYGGVLVLGDGDTNGCLVPLDRLDDTGIRDALPRLLPGFDKRKLEAATQKRPPARILCWRREGYVPPEPADLDATA